MASRSRRLHASSRAQVSHFDTQLLVERLQKHGMTRQQAEGVMTVLADAVDESVHGMEAGLVSKAEQEKVSPAQPRRTTLIANFSATLHTECRLCTAQVRVAAAREERLDTHEGRERPPHG